MKIYFKHSVDNALSFTKRQTVDNCGFTLPEILITLAIGGVVMAAVMSSFYTQHRAYLVHDEVVEMQQNLRQAMDLMIREIRMAGYDPTGEAGAGVVTATAGHFGFTMDLNGDGDTEDPNETLTFGFSSQHDTNTDGVVNSGSAPLGRNTGTATGTGGSGFQPIAENFQALEFYYLMADGSFTLTPTEPEDIRGVKISILAQTAQPDPNYTDTKEYETASGEIWGPYNDGFRRQLLIQTVICRNLGL